MGSRLDPSGPRGGMKYVLDASVALKWVLSEPDTGKACQLRDDFRKNLLELIAPDAFVLEIAHALTKAQRRGMIPDAWRLWVDVMTTAPLLFPSSQLTPPAIQIASQAGIGVYDCLYVALAERQKCELVTADVRLQRALQSTCPFIISLSTVP